jgi:hypothetical protein
MSLLLLLEATTDSQDRESISLLYGSVYSANPMNVNVLNHGRCYYFIIL